LVNEITASILQPEKSASGIGVLSFVDREIPYANRAGDENADGNLKR
jgi:hypothetical protein